VLDKYGNRKYLTSSERRRFLAASLSEDSSIHLFCRTLLETGCRISEALNLTLRNIDIDECAVIIRCLKKRDKTRYRVVPISAETTDLFARLKAATPSFQHDERIWTWSRMTGYRHVRAVMAAADIHGQQASPKGLRHGFAVAALEAGVPINLVQRWLGHAHWSTTAIYADVVGPEERGFAERIWLATRASSQATPRSLRGRELGEGLQSSPTWPGRNAPAGAQSTLRVGATGVRTGAEGPRPLPA